MGAIQLSRTGIRSRIGPASITLLRREFKRHHYLLLRGFLHPGMLDLILDQVERTRFELSKHGFGLDQRMNETPGVASLNFLLNDRSLFRCVECITGCSKMGSLTGAVRRAVPRPGDALRWHDDNIHDRMVAITINLGSTPYEGGVLQIRRKRSKKIFAEVANTGPGDAVIFPVSPELEHHNTPVSGAVAKTAFSGWFLSKPDFEADFRAKFRSRGSSSAREAAADACGGIAAIAPDMVFSVPAQIVSRRLGEDTIVLNVASGDSFCLDTIGRQIWDLLGRGNSVRAASCAIAAEYGVTVREVTNDTMRLIGQLLAHGLIERPHSDEFGGPTLIC